MEATKYTLTVECQALSMDCMKGLLIDAANAVAEGKTIGKFVMDDGDTVSWFTVLHGVSF